MDEKTRNGIKAIRNQEVKEAQYADKDMAVDAMKNHLLTGSKNPIS